MYRYMENRKKKVEATFREQNDTSDEDILGAMKKLENVLKKENKTWWEVVTLEHYVADQIISRRLRIKKSCAFEAKTKEFLDDWYRILDNCSFSLIDLILKERREDLKPLKKK